jgi:hypothetical protein
MISARLGDLGEGGPIDVEESDVAAARSQSEGDGTAEPAASACYEGAGRACCRTQAIPPAAGDPPALVLWRPIEDGAGTFAPSSAIGEQLRGSVNRLRCLALGAASDRRAGAQ